MMTTSPADGEVLDTIQRLLGSRICVTMTDGRGIASGKFMSLDRLGSIMLEDVEQRWLAYHDVSTADNKDTSETG
jgi:small nuclear ribonucleoprotein (snRNP)-like protein